MRRRDLAAVDSRLRGNDARRGGNDERSHSGSKGNEITITKRVYESRAHRVSSDGTSKVGQGVRSTFLGSWASAERYAARTTSRVRRPSSPLAPDGSPSVTPRRKSASMSAFMSSPVYDHDGEPVSWSKVRKGWARGSTSSTPEVPAILRVTSPQVG